MPLGRSRSGWASGGPRSPGASPAVPAPPAPAQETVPEASPARVGDLAAAWMPTLGRYLLALVFVWFGYNEIVQPGIYTQYVPFVAEASTAATVLVSVHGWVLLALALLLFLGIAPRLTAAVSALLLLEIVIDLAVSGLSDTMFRDVGVLGLAVTLAGSKNQRLLMRL